MYSRLKIVRDSMIHIQKGDKTRSTDKRMGNRYAFTGDNGIPGHC